MACNTGVVNTKRKNLLLILSASCALAVVVGIFVARVQTRSVGESSPTTDAVVADAIPAPPPEATPTSPAPWIAVVDLNRILATTPRLRAFETEHEKELPRKVEMYGERGTNVFNMESQVFRQWVIRDDIRPVIAARAAAHKMPLVFDRNGRTTNGVPAVLYSTGVTNLSELANAPGVIDLTEEVLHEVVR